MKYIYLHCAKRSLKRLQQNSSVEVDAKK